jgi:adenosylcobinamide-phosphate synthase
MTSFLVLAWALVIDRCIGDPSWLWRRVPHPVAVAGMAIAVGDARLNAPAAPDAAKRRRGMALIAGLVIAALLLGWALHRLLGALPAPLGPLAEALVLAVLLAQRDLLGHVAAVAERLVPGDLPGARLALSRIVGRDVDRLDEAGMARATIESAAESFSDGVVAPAFWYALLGLPGVLAFKVVSTADSMIGHRTPRHAAFGWAAARLDDIMNFVPARISVALLAAAAPLVGRSPAEAFAVARHDAARHESPNAGWPEAAAAGALGVALGGPRSYDGAGVEGAWLNADGRHNPDAHDVRTAIRLIDAAWLILTTLAAAAAVILAAIAR